MSEKTQKLADQQSHIDSISLLSKYCSDIEEWPENWAGEQTDIQIGHDIIEQFKPFIITLINKNLSKKTIKTYINYLGALGGELIRQINYDNECRQLSAKDLILKYIDDSGGPHWRHAYNEQDHSRYDSVCKRLFKFMTENID